MITRQQMPFEHPAEEWTGDEAAVFTSDTDGFPCAAATLASIVWEPTAGTFTSITLVFEGYKPESGWTIMELDEETYTDNLRHDDKRVDVTEFTRFGWRGITSAGGTTADKFTSFS